MDLPERPMPGNAIFSHTPTSSAGRKLMEMVRLLWKRFGPQYWWPAETPLEVIIGAVLTQNTNWKNVEKAMENLRGKGLLSLDILYSMEAAALAQEIQPAGYYNVKAKRLKNLVDYIFDRFEGDLSAFLEAGTPGLREGLLSVKGVGPETADSILLYAAERPVFVVDAYTYRILHRHGMVEDPSTYEELQALFMDHLPEDPSLFNEFHALIVRLGKEFCRRKPLCPDCPLSSWESTDFPRE